MFIYTYAYTYITIIYVYRYVLYTHSIEESRGLLRARPYAPYFPITLYAIIAIAHTTSRPISYSLYTDALPRVGIYAYAVRASRVASNKRYALMVYGYLFI